MTRSAEGAWNPGLHSDIPQALLPLVTLFREENAFVTHAEASELSDLTGLKILELVSLRPERLVIHALLVRVTADLSVPDGPRYAELGINMRGMVEKLHVGYAKANIPEIEAVLSDERSLAHKYVTVKLQEAFNTSPVENTGNTQSEKVSLWSRWFGSSVPSPSRESSSEHDDMSVIQGWKQGLEACEEPLQKLCLEALIKTINTIIGHRGRMLPDLELVGRVVVNRVMNVHGSAVVDGWVDTFWSDAVEAEGYRPLPAQDKPLIMNVKGASASGKSTIRPQQRLLAQKLDIPWEDFALISPDYWRKYLLDYSTLGDYYKYGAMLTGRELEIVDKKLDSYMAKKAENGMMSHMLIDRFRFDSFIVDIDRAPNSKLLSRFGDSVYLFFMVTHPAETVLRAWGRGKTTGRYKAVDDLLFHNVEAFTGMPSLFLSWVTSKDKHVHFEFLDNDVPKGELPRTSAFGYNQVLVVLDVALLLNVDRYRKVNIAARNADEIFTPADLDATANTGFIVKCAETVDLIVFADQDTAIEYAIVQSGQLVWWDHTYIQSNEHTEGLIEVLRAVGYTDEPCNGSKPEYTASSEMSAAKGALVGHWSDGQANAVRIGHPMA